MTLRCVSKLSILAALVVSSAAAVGCATSAGTKAAGSPDEQFMVEVAQANLAEIEAGRLAVTRASSPEVKAYGQQMIDDHTQANAELSQLAQSKGITLPTRPDEQHVQVAKHLEKLSGAEFDREYLGHMHGDHAKVVTMFEDKAKTAQDPELRAWAEKTLPVLKKHLDASAELHKQEGKSEPSEPNVGM